MKYFEVGLGVKRYWASPHFTYSSNEELAKGSIVRVPFGPRKKTGIVVSKTQKPTFKVKGVSDNYQILLSDETQKFIAWYRQYYATQGGQAFSQLLPGYLLGSSKPDLKAQPKQTFSKTPSLTREQEQTKKEILTTPKPTVLHGTTGSGKTRIYASLILDQLAKGKNALLLYPEIALTPQISIELEKFASVIVFHSGLTNSQRSKLWFKVARSSEPYVVIGARSALFLPHKNLGIIILDEAHETSYKQDTDVRYNGILVAGGLSKAHGAKLVLGSATPPITESELIIGSGGNLVCLHKQAIDNLNTKMTYVIDKKNKELFKKNYLISDVLIDSISRALKEKRQSLLFINRRGTAKLMFCDSCSWQADCPDCDLPATYHHDTHILLCHTCGKKIKLASMCPDCGGKLQLRSFGSKAIVEDVQKLFPKAKIGRFDSDNNKENTFANNYEGVRKGNIDILIGTQQLVKGLDLPLLSIVGVLDADLSLHFPDYSSEERTFQLISQVAGRVGRGHADGEIYIQSFQPNNPVIQLSRSEDWHSFRDRELALRKKHKLPPFVFAAKIIFRDKKIDNAYKNAFAAKQILQKNKTLIVDGPLPSYTVKRGGYFYIQLHLKSSSRTNLINASSLLPADAIYEFDPITLL